MTRADTDPARPRTEAQIADDLRLRPDPPRVMRLSRKAVTTAATMGGLGLGAILIVALQDRRGGDEHAELYSTDRVQQAEGLSTLPGSYADIPRLGPPLPGYLGRPTIAAQERGVAVPTGPVTAGPTPLDPDEQRRLQEIESARLSALFAEARTVPPGGAPAGGAAPAGPGGLPSLPPSPGASDSVAAREAFLARATGRDPVSPERLALPPSPYILQAGSVIPAALITGLRSDLPGQIAAQVTAPVYDSPSGRYLLIPQGARLLGEYDSRIAAGQTRLLLVWTRLILPDGRSIILMREPGADASGAAGLEDEVDNHWGRILLAAGLATLLNIGAELGVDSDDDIARAIREAAQGTVGRAGDDIVRRQLSAPPTLTIRPGFPVRVMVTRDLILEPLGEIR